jgi:hypothetical protein
MLPLLAFVTAGSLARLQEHLPRMHLRAFTVALAAVISVSTTIELVHFVARPTTPMAEVAEVGLNFKELARRLGIDDPTLAHHDAGGTSYVAGLEVVDLAGLGTRDIAKHMNDREFITHYLLEKRRPTFICGVKENFAAGKTHFYEDPRFVDGYIPLQFMRGGHAVMEAGPDVLCHIRRDLAHCADGVVIEGGSTTNELVRVDLDWAAFAAPAATKR